MKQIFRVINPNNGSTYFSGTIKQLMWWVSQEMLKPVGCYGLVPATHFGTYAGIERFFDEFSNSDTETQLFREHYYGPWKWEEVTEFNEKFNRWVTITRRVPWEPIEKRRIKPYRVLDDCGKTVSFSLIKEEYRRAIKDKKRVVEPTPAWKRNRRKRTSPYHFEFRNGPVPNAGGGNRNGHWQKYRGDHCGIRPWKRDFYAAQVEQREVREEYGVTFKNPDKIPYPYHVSFQRGWKRTRKEKQWM